MSNYNPHAPTVIGNEWAPAVDASFQVDAVTEQGYTFDIPTSSRVVSGAVYLETTPLAEGVEDNVMMHLYRAGTEIETGPVRKVVIPVNGGDVVTATVNFGNSSTVAEALAVPGDAKYVIFNDVAPGDSGTIRMFFDVDSVAPILSGKRILNVDFIYTAAGSQPDQLNVSAVLNAKSNGASNSLAYYGDIVPQPLDTTALVINRTHLGMTNVFIGGLRFTNDGRRFPWTLRELQRFQSGATNQIDLRLATSGFVDTYDSTGVTKIVELDVFYAALEVTYCEETRIMYGGKSGNAAPTPVFGPLLAGQNRIMLQTANTHAVSGNLLSPGSYTVTVTSGDTGDVSPSSEKPTVSAIRQLYPLASIDGVKLTRTLTPDAQAISKASTNVIVPLTLHGTVLPTSGGHVYQRRVAGPAYGLLLQQTVSAAHALPALTAPSYPQVRFYARRFGHTETSLTIKDATSPGAPTASISITDFDALPEIVDGWREVTLRFTGTAPTFTSVDVDHVCTWYPSSGTVTSPGNQWQVLGAIHDAPASTATVWNQRRLSYSESVGSTIYLTTGANTFVTGLADATIIFSQDPPAVTGLAVSPQTQSVTVIDPECAATLECMPTGISYLQVVWNAFGVYDPFTRVVSSSFGTAYSGQAWTTSGGVASDYNVTGTTGTIVLSTVNVARIATIPVITGINVHVEAILSLDQIPVGAAIRAALLMRYADASNHYRVELQWETTGEVNLRTVVRNAGVDTVISSVPIVIAYTAGTRIKLVGEVRPDIDTYFYVAAKAWALDTPVPDAWQSEGVDSTLNATGLTGIRAIALTSNTNVNPTITVDDFRAYDMDLGYVELQRLDTVDLTWQTIMQASDTAAFYFNDYEARVGVPNVYRARTANALDFFGLWSTAVTGTVAAPGITTAGSGNSTLIFTSNEAQDGSVNLAYTMTWDRAVEEGYAFPEADDVTLQKLYRRDFQVAFRPLERGGEQFTRNILVQNAAVATGRVRNGFRSLRDMAWEQLSYVCVRDELGDRWLAAVLVPNGVIRRNRRLYIAQVQVIEVTDTPSIVLLELP